MHNALVCINNQTFYQALPGRQPHLLPPLEGGHHGDPDTKGQHKFARVRGVVAVAVIGAIAKQRLVRGDERSQAVAMDRSEHTPGDLVDVWYEAFLIKTSLGWRGLAQIAAANGGERHISVRSQGGTLDRRYQEVGVHVPYLVFLLLALVDHQQYHWSIIQMGALFQQSLGI